MAGQQMGSATGGQTTAVFKDAAGWNTPNGVLSLMENYLQSFNKPIPVATAESVMGSVMPKPTSGQIAQAEGQAVHGIEKYATPDGTIDRAGLLRYLADAGNNVPGLKPDLKLVKQAADMLNHFGIQDDKDGATAIGVARMSMAGVTVAQSLQKNNGDVNATLTEIQRNGPAALGVR